jgi:putative ABC transport system permease protein
MIAQMGQGRAVDCPARGDRNGSVAPVLFAALVLSGAPAAITSTARRMTIPEPAANHQRRPAVSEGTPPGLGGLMHPLWQDLKFGTRLLVTQRRFTVVATVILALGVGTPTAVFSIVNAALLRPLPYHEPERLVAIRSVFQSPGRQEVSAPRVTLAEITAWRRTAQRLSAMGAFAYTQIPVQVGGRAFSPVTALLDPQFLPTLGVSLAAGSHFPEGPAGEWTAIISHRLWTVAFDANRDAIGRTLLVDGQPHVLLGVLPPDFQFPRSDASYYTQPVDLLIPPSSVPGFSVDFRQWWGIGRLAPGVTVAEAEAELEAIAQEGRDRASDAAAWSPRLVALAEETTRTARQPLLIVLGIAGVLLLVASTNLMNLFFARGVARLREMAIRRAMGSSTGRIVRQMLTEGLLLALLGGAAGVLLAVWAVRGVVALSPVHVPVSGVVDLDWRVLGFSFGICVAASLAASLVPALHVSARSEQAIRGAGRRTSAGRGATRFQQGLCVAQIGLGVALLVSAGLLANSLWRLGAVKPGFSAERVIGFNLSIPGDQARERWAGFYASALEAVRSIPGVDDAGFITFLPPEMRAGVFMGFAIEGMAATPSDEPRVVNTLVASSSYFRTVQMPIVGGRNFEPGDRAGGAPVILVNETLARRFFPEGDAIGRRVGTGFDGLEPVRQIVGIVADSHDRGLGTAPVPTVYIPFEQFSLPYGSIAVRTSLTSAGIEPVVRQRINALNPAVPLTDFQTLEQRLAESLREPRFYTLVASACAAMAVLFVTFGLYGLVSYSVSRRTAEIGLRMAIGAPPGLIQRMVLFQGLRLALAGVALGLVLAILSTRSLQALLFEITPLDPLTLVAAAAVTLAATVAASYGPARRASRLEPIVALRCE